MKDQIQKDGYGRNYTAHVTGVTSYLDTAVAITNLSGYSHDLLTNLE